MAIINKNLSPFTFPDIINTRIYSSNDYGALVAGTSYVTGRVNYTPIYVNHRAIRPNMLIQALGTNSNVNIQLGIYNGKDGLNGAPLLWSGLVSPTTSGIYRSNTNLILEEEWYVLASNCITNTTFNISSTSLGAVKGFFGESTGVVSINSANNTAHHAQTLPSLTQNISGTINMVNYNPINVCLEY